jgi:RND superfamily putative drug exporter
MRRRPLVPAVIALLVIAILIAPFSSMRLGSSDQGNDPNGSTTRVAYDLLAQGFGPGFNGPLQLVAKVHGAEQEAAMAKVAKDVAMQPGVVFVAPPVKLPHSLVEIVQVFPSTSPQAAETTALINHLRSTTIPAATAGTGLTVYVGGFTAIFVDFAHVLGAKLPLFVGLVVLVSFLLLGWVFRSIVIPVTAAVMNLISIGAAYGILTAVFQHGVLGSLFGVTRTGPIESFIPVMMFAILFGLSMDYEIFLLTRIHEEWLHTGDNKLAVRNGLAATGKTITAAALIMVLVFASFILGGQIVIKEFGLGLAAGVIVDAIIIRMAVVPSVMQLLGRSNWWFPKWLDRILPDLSVEPPEEREHADESVGS